MSASVGSCRRMLTRKVTEGHDLVADIVAIIDYAASGESRPSTLGRART